MAPDGGSVTIRITGPFQGQDPLRAEREGTPGGQSAAFIEEHAEYTQFKAGTGERGDTVAVACFLTQ